MNEWGERPEAVRTSGHAPQDGAARNGGRPARDRVELAFFTDEGTPARLPAVCWDELPAGQQRHPLRARPMTLGEDWRVMQYRLAHTARGDHRARDRLEAEVGVGLAVRRAFGDAPYHQLFARFGGYHLDVREPFVFYEPARGRPLAALAGRATVKEQERIRSELVLAVRLLEAVDVVHRGLTPHTVRWDGRHVRLPEPCLATRAGHPREALGEAPWAAPEQRAGHGTADPRDDLWSVAQVMYHLVTGREGDPDGPPRDLARLPALGVLSGAFAPTARERDHPAEVLRMLNRQDPLQGRPLPADPLDPGRRAFDDELARKRAALGLDGDPVAETGPGRTPGRGLRALFGAGRTGMGGRR
ncbi:MULTISPECIES: serine/threonine-protein kinase [Streptomyces]|uniref:Protein kinase domain-containing protein n=2 Tax=Streptomyces rimosus subsp. rimosus TaxID=132474 RepID=A0A8A1UT35_STRR1|nr:MULTISPECIES: hypothetical protein [Streptomyces]MYT45551.1 hypothetical protein [Streptomyces sp. SID5471]KUJ37441.1 hypothetical protein ADK46_14975 [Streptomyces rimosus subsp. rimosus]QDA03856.1 hypothetical protein CTZ40_09005 [Streptomyces rimosus]QEV75137.1 hypothetical protein CP984_08975 [Streptomyces rimosus]QGY67928.1 hypothetical protein V519_020135 [Streptomyces rimosus R6-500]